MLSKPVLYLSHHLKRQRREYYERRQAVRGVGDWGVGSRLPARRLLLRERNRSDITAHLGRGAAQAHPGVAVRPADLADAQKLTGTSYAPTNQIIARLTEPGILKEITGNARNRGFRYEPYVRRFMDEPEDVP